MENVRKKQKKSPLSKGLLLAMLLFLAAALLFVLFVLLREDSTVPPPDPNSGSTQQRLYECENSNIDSIRVLPPDGESYTLIYHNDTLVLMDDTNYPIRDSIVTLILNNAAHIIAEKTVLDTSKTITDLSDFGLENPQCAAVITYKDGTVNTLRVGDQIRAGIPYYYFMWNDDPVIYAVSTDVYDAFSQQFSTLHAIVQPSWDSELWDSIEIKGENTRTLLLTDFGWQITEPHTYPLDTELADNFLSNLENIRFSQYVGEADELALNQYGLDEPRLSLTIRQAASVVRYLDNNGSEVSSAQLPAENIVLHCGNAIDDYFFYVEYLGTVYTASQFQLGMLWNADHSTLFEPYPANIDITLVKKITITQKNGSTEYEIRLVEQLEENGDLKTDDAGNVLYDVVVRKDGEFLDSNAFLLWYAQLRQLTGESTLPKGTSPDGEPDITITFDGESSRRTLAFHAYDQVYYMLAVDGTVDIYLPRTAVDALLNLPE